MVARTHQATIATRRGKSSRSFLLHSALIVLAACGDADMPVTATPTVPDFASVTPQQWEALASRRIFFGHQSVGENIMDGVRDLLARNPQIPLRLVGANEPGPEALPGLYHAKVGRNGDVASKSDAFAAATTHLAPSVALLKYCYVDVTGESDPEALFRDYRTRMRALRDSHPGLVVMHATMPLTDVGGTREWLAGKVRGETTKRDLNRIRNRYNDLLRAEYAGQEPVFDIARIESTLADGSRTFFGRGGGAVYYLAPFFTDDGGHLNADGRRAAAEHLLALLATL